MSDPENLSDVARAALEAFRRGDKKSRPVVDRRTNEPVIIPAIDPPPPAWAVRKLSFGGSQ